MLATLGTRDPANNGKFIIGVMSTGIYCLPSCHARTPKAENVQFFACGSDAEAAGLRPCKKCRPDEYERGEDSELARLEEVVDRIRQEPGEFSGVDSIAESLEVGVTKANSLFRLHYQQTPAEVLGQARFQRAKDFLLNSGLSVTEIAFEVGYESLSTFNENFKRKSGLTPSEYRQLPSQSQFQFQLPPNYNLPCFLSSFGRDPMSPTERLLGTSGLLATPNGDLLKIEFGPTAAVTVVKGSALSGYETVARVMSLGFDVRPFEAGVEARGFGHLLESRKGARLPQTQSLLDGLIWAIAGQQVNLAFAFALRKRLIERYGTPVGEDLYTLPTWESLACAKLEDLTAMQFSARKAEYLIGIAKLGGGWGEALATSSYTRASKALLAVKGIGIWSSQYILMRALGFADCLPLGDTGLTAGVSKLFGLEAKPTLQQIETLTDAFAPYRSLATYHLWQSLK